MLGITKIRGPLIMTVLPLKKYDAHRKSITEPEETGMERIKKIFVISEHEPLSKELQSLITFTSGAGIFGMFIGGLLYTQGTVQKFIDTNQATRFYGHYDARKQLQFALTKQFLKGGFQFSWKVALFSAIFESVQILLTTYRGEPSVLHYVAGGSIAGCLFKMSLGIKGAIVGLIVGGILAGIGGSLKLFVLHLTGLTIEDLQNLDRNRAIKKDAQFQKIMAESMDDNLKESILMYKTNKTLQTELPMEPEKAKN